MALPGLDLRDGVQGLVTYADSDLDALWQQVGEVGPAASALHDILPGLVDTYGAAAGALAANWYDGYREASEISGTFTATPVDLPDTGAHALVGWALTEATDLTAFRSLIAGGLQRRIANSSRATVTNAAVSDPKATGWQRVGSGECPFCAMLIARGAVYREATADFGAHDHCKCSAVPAFGDQPLPVRPYTPTSRDITDADRARTREWIATNL